MGKLLIIIGSILVIAGVVIMLGGKITGLPKLPGDILIKKDNFTFYFPIVTSIIISIVLTIIFYFLQRLK